MQPNFNMVLQHFQSSFSHFGHIPKTYNMHLTTQNNIALQSVSKSFSMLKDTFWHSLLIYLPHYSKSFKAQKGQTLNPKVCQKSFSMLKDTFWHSLIYLPHYSKNFKAQKKTNPKP
jgi:hypothetical protein